LLDIAVESDISDKIYFDKTVDVFSKMRTRRYPLKA